MGSGAYWPQRVQGRALAFLSFRGSGKHDG